VAFDTMILALGLEVPSSLGLECRNFHPACRKLGNSLTMIRALVVSS